MFILNPRQFFGPATIRHSPPRTVVTSASNICCDYAFSTELYSCLSGLKVKKVHRKPVLEWAN